MHYIINKKVLYVANVYRPPPSENDIFEHLATDIEHLQSSKGNPKIVVMGDFNCHHANWLGSMDVHGNPKTNDAGNACYNLCQMLGMVNLIKENTFIRNSGQAVSVLDLLLTDSPNLIKNISFENPVGSSSHTRVAINLIFDPSCHVMYKKTSWLYHKGNWEDLRNKLGNSDWNFNEDVNLAWDKCKANIKLAMDQHIPKRVIKRRINDKAWFTDKCALVLRKKVKAWKSFKDIPSAANKEAYRLALKSASDTYARAQKLYAEKIETDLKENGSNSKTWWHIVNHVVGKGGNSAIPSLRVNDTDYDTVQEKANILKDTFAKKSCIDDDYRTPPLLPNKSAAFLNRIKIRLRDVKKKLTQLKIKKATGPDGIPARVLRECAVALSRPLARLYNLSMKRGIVPNDWKCANVVPVYKSGDRSDPNNYRPISLLSIIGKVMESIVNDNVKKHLFGANLITKHQYGFRPKHSTFDHLTSATQTWENALNNGEEVRVAALDISRAFDTVWHKGLLTKLMSVGIGGCVYRWMRAFLQNRSIRVILDGQQSASAYINAGVPQGSILGPTLFLIFINDLLDSIKNQVHMFADDTTISAIIPNQQDKKAQVNRNFQSDLHTMEEWAETWLVTFNAKKTQLLTISRKKVKEQNPSIKFVNENLTEVSNIKLLGINITSTLDWNSHVNKVAKHAGQRLGILRKAKKMLPNAALSTLYKTKIRSVMEYCGPIWQNASKCSLSKLDAIQKKVCRLLGKKQDCIPEYNINSLQQRRNVSGLCQIHRMVTGVAPSTVIHLLPAFNEPNRISRYVSQSHHYQFQLKRSKSDHHKNSFIPQMTKLWNSLPIDCVYSKSGDINELQNFKISINKYLNSTEK